MKRGQIWWADVAAPTGAEPGYRRPVLVVQSEAFNRSHIGTAIAVAITSNLKLASAPGNVLLPRRNTQLERNSVANVSQIVTLDKHCLSTKVSNLEPTLLRQVEDGIRLVLDL